jgi:hypothetical protein
MQAIQAFALAAATGLILAVAVCLLFRRTLDALLCELCGGAVRGRFWMLFGNVGIVLATLWVSLWFVPRAPDAASAASDPVRVFVRTLSGATFGLLAAMALLGLVLMIGIGSFNARNRRAAPPALPSALGERGAGAV